MRYVGLVRAVMIGREGLTREALLGVAADAGAHDAVSHLATGNLTFDCPAAVLDGVVARLESGVSAVVGRPTLVAVRPLAFVQTLLARQPFADRDQAGWECEVAFLRHDAPTLAPGALPDPGRTVIVAVGDRELAAARPRDGAARPACNRLLERASGLHATARGIGTLERLAKKG